MIAVVNTPEVSQEEVLPSMTSDGCGEVYFRTTSCPVSLRLKNAPTQPRRDAGKW